MALDFRNAERYADPTAYHASLRIDRKEREAKRRTKYNRQNPHGTRVWSAPTNRGQ